MAATSHAGNGQIPGAGTPLQFTRDEELTAYREMLLIRRFEEKAGQLYGMGFIGGFCHPTSARKRSSSGCRWRSSRATR